VVRGSRPVDLPAVARLRWTWAHERGSTSPLTRAEFEAAFIEWSLAHTAAHHCVVAAQNDELIGMAWLAVLDRVPNARNLERRSGDLQAVYVLPERRGHGIGTRLVDHLILRSYELGLERVTVHSSERATDVYLRSGFTTSRQLLLHHLPGASVTRPPQA
jgi:GNAT superfamily N-acetyltransferase